MVCRPPFEPSREPRRILVRATNWIGDVLLCAPAMEALRRRFPRAHVAVLARRSTVAAVRAAGYADEVIPIDDRGRHRGLIGRLRLARALRRRRFDLAVLLPKSFESALVVWLAGVPLRVGRDTDARGRLLTHRVDGGAGDRHHALQFGAVVEALGGRLSRRRPRYAVSATEEAFAEDVLRAAEVAEGERVIAVHPGASKAPRSWHLDRLAATMRTLAERYHVRFVILGGPDDREAVAELARAAGRSPLVPETATLGEMAALIKHCDLFVGNDSGPMHVASAVGTPVVALFGPGSPTRTAPLAPRRRYEVVTKSFPCSPCRQDFFRECRPAPSGKPYCLEEIAVDDVVAAIERQLAKARRRPSVVM